MAQAGKQADTILPSLRQALRAAGQSADDVACTSPHVSWPKLSKLADSCHMWCCAESLLSGLDLCRQHDQKHGGRLGSPADTIKSLEERLC